MKCKRCKRYVDTIEGCAMAIEPEDIETDKDGTITNCKYFKE